MFELIFASLLFQAAAGIWLVLFAAGSAAQEMLRGRRSHGHAVAAYETGVVVELPVATRMPKPVSRGMDARPEAA